MKKIILLMLVLIMLTLSACGGSNVPKDDGIVDNFVIDGEEVSAVDFVTESCNKFLQSEKYIEAKEYYKETQGEPIPFAVTRVIDLKAYGIGSGQMDIHYMLIKAKCNWKIGEDLSDEITLVADYDTGEVRSSIFDSDESWFTDDTKKEYWTYVMLNSCFVSSDYKNDPIIGRDVETRAEFTADDIAAVNAGIIQ